MKTLERNTDGRAAARGGVARIGKSFSVIASIEDRMLNGKVRNSCNGTDDGGRRTGIRIRLSGPNCDKSSPLLSLGGSILLF